MCKRKRDKHLAQVKADCDELSFYLGRYMIAVMCNDRESANAYAKMVRKSLKSTGQTFRLGVLHW